MNCIVDFCYLIDGKEFPFEKQVGGFDKIWSQGGKPASPNKPVKRFAILKEKIDNGDGGGEIYKKFL